MFGKAFGKLSVLAGTVLSIIVGVFFIVISCIIMSSSGGDYIKTTAVITNIETDFSDYEEFGGEVQHKVLVTYTADGKEYKDAELGEYSSDMREGQEIEIEYSADDPSVIRGSGAGIFPIIFLIIGIITVIASVFFGIRSLIL